LFGDIHDPESVVSKAITERGGYQLMPEWNTKPANHYLPRKMTSASGCGESGCSCKTASAEPTPQTLDAQLERGQLHLASVATRISRTPQ
jgi:hypothetical protein